MEAKWAGILFLALAATGVSCADDSGTTDDGGGDAADADTDSPAEAEAEAGADAADVPADEGGSGCTAATAVGTTAVTVADFSFTPGCIRVSAGATVTWTNTGLPTHTVTSDPGAPVTFNSGALGTGGTFSFAFPSAATVPYHCTPHELMGMRGTVIVE
jgi:plastocyanin